MGGGSASRENRSLGNGFISALVDHRVIVVNASQQRVSALHDLHAAGSGSIIQIMVDASALIFLRLASRSAKFGTDGDSWDAAILSTSCRKT